jgi:cyanophycinase-like exopeptidase
MTGRSFALLGSGEFEPWTDEADRWLLERSSRSEGPVLILPTASAPEGDDVFDRWGDIGLTHYGALGIPAEVVPLKTRSDADREDLAAKLDIASSVYFSGGNPAYLVDTLAGSTFWQALVERIERGLPYAGCSGGISCLGEIAPDSRKRDPASGDIWRPGLRLFPNVVFAPHWDMVDTYVPGLSRFIVEAVPPDCRLMAVDEHTAVVGDGVSWSVIGLGHGRLMEGEQWTQWGPGEHFTAALLPAR